MKIKLDIGPNSDIGEGFKVKDDKSVRRKEGSKNGDFRSDIL